MPKTTFPQALVWGLVSLASACWAADPTSPLAAGSRASFAEHAENYISQLHALEKRGKSSGMSPKEFQEAANKLHYDLRDQAPQPEQRLAAYRAYMPKWFTDMANDDKLADYPRACLRSLNDAYGSVQGYWKWEDVSYWTPTAQYVAEKHKPAFEAKGQELMAQQVAGPLHAYKLTYLTRYEGDKPRPAVRIHNRGEELVTGRYNIVVMDWHGRRLGETRDLLVQLEGGKYESFPVELELPYSAFPLILSIEPGRKIESLAQRGVEPVHLKQSLLLPQAYLQFLQNSRFASRFGRFPEDFANQAGCHEAWLTGDPDQYRAAVKRLATRWIEIAAKSGIPQSAGYCKAIRELTLKYLATLPPSQEPAIGPATDDLRIRVELRPDKSGKLYPVGIVNSAQPVRIDGRLFVQIFDGKTLVGEIDRDLYSREYAGEIPLTSDGFYPIEELTTTVEARITEFKTETPPRGSF